ncbi:PDZ domain-containing RING finger protein 4-like isoform X2 [Dendronephthya gigantea]|nr:PDZ domain-containing RING finger protein 4-like isoform X2 [Dendronephthya gigantea]XP_028398453.1 PDZ domain-containing RING finger protein 4-like isoform X2 [Dendronephthya gigantea]XP_028398455.1 PDZ domain-containing RING finger protein 4-like isoform X2 [Dendronephthya gigantea]XP_028398456.1 PDZ domain-containing RING finger protein 4-like isoform X2 [Dendronephthya gigantea]XP_028398457.1 PDZ domain-containing RING finger protein 4-like isoform X2 [Dendronephthya gigantea]XP_0283984
MLAHLEVCDYTKKDSVTGLPSATCSIDRLSAPEVGMSQVFVCSKGCGLPLLFQDSSEHDCVKSLQAQVSSLQTKLTRSEHEREKVSARLVKREEAMQERFTQLERDLRAYQEQTLNYERRSRDQRSQINYLRRQLDSRGSDQVTEENEVRITLERSGGILGLNIRGGTEENDGHCGIYVSRLVENSPASEKLQLYDRILEINEVDLTNASHQEAVKAFKNAGDKISITVRRLLNSKAGDMFSTGFASIGVQTEAIDPSEMNITCCRCRSNRSSQEFSSQGAINIIHQKEDSGVDEIGEHQSDADGCEANELKNNTGYTSDDVKPRDEILNRLLLNTSLAALGKRSSRLLPADSCQTPYEPEDSSELQSLSNGYYSGNVSQASLENVKPTDNGGLESNTQRMTPDEECYSPNNETDQLYFDSELEYEYEEITIRMCGRKALGMKLYSGNDEDANSVFVDEVDPRSVVGNDGRVIEGDQILKINDLAVTCLEDAVELLSERHNEIKFLVARPVAELQATLLGAESDHGEFHDQSRFHLEAYPIGVIQEEDEEEAETVIGDKSREDEKDSGFGKTDDSTKNDSEQDGGEDRLLRDEKEQHKAQMDALGKQIIHFTACASNARELGLRDSPREKSSDEHSQRSGEREKRDGRSSKHSSRKSGSKTSSDENHSSGLEHRNKKSHKSTRSSESNPASSKSKERSEGKEKERGEHRRKKEKSRDGGDSNRSVRSSRDDRVKNERGLKQNGHSSSNENPEMKVQWRVRRNKDGSRIFISKKLKPAKQRLLRERAQKLAEERRGLTTDDETQSVYLGRYWSREDRRRQLDKVREARRTKRVEIEAERKGSGTSTKRNDFQIIELTQKKMACTEQTFDDFMTVEEILRQRNRLGMSSGPVFVTTV